MDFKQLMNLASQNKSRAEKQVVHNMKFILWVKISLAISVTHSKRYTVLVLL